jgi:hypothetical protein
MKMQPASFDHLSEEALDDFLIGLVSPESEHHLADCELCRDKVQSLRSDLQTFNQASLSWSQSKPLLHLRPLVTRRAPGSRFASPRWAMALLVLLLLGGALLRYQRNSGLDNNAPAAPVTVDDETQIAQDNRMLQSVEMALNDSESPAIAEYHLSDSPRHHPKMQSGLKHP